MIGTRAHEDIVDVVMDDSTTNLDIFINNNVNQSRRRTEEEGSE